MMCVTNFPVAKRLWKTGGGESIKSFCRKFFVSQCQKFWLGNPSLLRFRTSLVAKKLMDKTEVSIDIFSQVFFCHPADKIRKGTL